MTYNAALSPMTQEFVHTPAKVVGRQGREEQISEVGGRVVVTIEAWEWNYVDGVALTYSDGSQQQFGYTWVSTVARKTDPGF